MLTKPLPTTLKGQTILIVDDNPTNLGIVSDYLQKFGFEIVVARNGENALKRMKYVQPDIILLDIMMPGLNGFETCKRLKANPETSEIPIIFMTALASTEDKVKGFKMGGVDYITKPIHHEEVLARVTTHLKLKNLTQQLQEQNQHLAKLNATKDKLFSIVAHDLKGPFQPLLMAAQLLSMRADQLPPDRLKNIGDNIHKTAQEVYDLLENLLKWARMQQGQIGYKPTEISLKQLAHQSIELFTLKAKEKDITLNNTIAENVLIYGDANMLNTVIRNLISNALKFTPTGGSVTIGCNASNIDSDFIEVFVTDTGIGISFEDLDKLFKIEVHHTTPGTDQEQGTGLGLIICQEMIAMHGGKIWVESELNQGTSIKFTLPVDEALLAE